MPDPHNSFAYPPYYTAPPTDDDSSSVGFVARPAPPHLWRPPAINTHSSPAVLTSRFNSHLPTDPWAPAPLWRPHINVPSAPMPLASPLNPTSPHPTTPALRHPLAPHLPASPLTVANNDQSHHPRQPHRRRTPRPDLSTDTDSSRSSRLNSNSRSSRTSNHAPSPNNHVSHASVREYNRTISACARRRDLNGALRALAELDAASNLSRNLFTYNAVINALVMCSQHARADEFWREMIATGISPNLVTFNTMLKSCFGGSDDDVQRAFRLLREMDERGIAADRVTLNSLINACVSAGRVRDAHGVYEQMRSLNIEPDAYTFCTLAKQARHQCDVSMLDALLLHQLHHHTNLQRRADAPVQSSNDSDPSLKISPVAYNTIADAYIRCGYPERAISLLERMRHPRSGEEVPTIASTSDPIPVSPDVQTFNVRLKALRESGAPASDAFAVLDEMGALGLEADHITLLTLADLCCRREDMSSAEGVLRAATQADIREFEKGTTEWKNLCNRKQPSRDTRGANMDTVSSSPRPSNNFVSSSHPQSHNSGGQNNGRRNANQPRNAKANAALFNALIRGYSSLDPPNMDRAVALYSDMRSYVERYGFLWYAADSVTYTMLVDGFARVGDATRAEVIVTEMETAGRSNVVAYNAYLKANRGKGFQAALSILERMKRAGVRPDVVTYNTVIDFLSSEENGTQIAEDLVLVDMPRNGVRPDLLTFNTLIKGVARNRGNKADAGIALSSAYRWLTELQSRGLKPDEFTYQSMVSACAAAGDAPRALEFFRKVEAERAKRFKGNGRSNGFNQGTGNGSTSNGTGTMSSHGGGSSRMNSGSNQYSRGNGMLHRKMNQGKMGNHGQSSSDWMLLPHPAAYVALMRAFLSSGAKDGVDSVLLLRDEMVARGLELGRTGYTAVADAYAQRADIDSVEATLREMLSHESNGLNQKLSPVHHCIRMKALCNGGRLDDAIGILAEVEDADTAVFNVLIFACAKNKDVERMDRVLRTMESLQIQPDAITARAMSSMMRSVARTLKSFDNRFMSSVSKFMDNMHSSVGSPSGSGSTNGVESGSKGGHSIWTPDGGYLNFDSADTSDS